MNIPIHIAVNLAYAIEELGKGGTRMSEADLKKLLDHFEKSRVENDTPEKARALLQKEGILDASGKLAEPFRES
jgi:hypothetical protein